ncbi:hypothetical protein BGZ83_008850 [Gryganskiella cystojenkinii]|nr:hypothetical protein BGZ83_008850 [Gryganskiella cystojenkinii]
MGQLEVNCFAEGADNALYALAFGSDSSIKTGDDAVAIIIKSNASASSPNALTWTTMSTIRKTELVSFLDNYQLLCSVDPNGSFLVWSYNTYAVGAPLGATSRPGGFRYDPTLATSSATTTGKGGWANIDTPLNYAWTTTSAGGDLFYVKDGAGNYNFYHAFSTGSKISLGVLNKAVTPNMMENSPVQWSISSAITGLVDGMKTSTTKMFVWGSSGGASPLFGVTDLPQTAPLSTTGPSLQIGNYSSFTGCWNPTAVNDKFYKACRLVQEHGVTYQLMVWDGTKALSPINMAKLPVEDQYKTYVSGVFGDASTNYMLVQSGSLSGLSTYTLKALALSGPSAGAILDVPNNITVSDSNLKFYTPPDSEGGSRGGGNKGWVAGLVALVVIITATSPRVRNDTKEISLTTL